MYLLKLVGFFFFLSYDNFLIGSFVLKFILNRILDWEKVGFYDLVIEVVDGGIF